MSKLRLRWLAVTGIATLASMAAVSRAATIDFEGHTDGTLVDNQYTGVGADFNGTATFLTLGVGLNPAYPPNSGTNVIYDFPTTEIRVDAVGGSWSAVSGYITGNTVVTLEAYDASNALLDSDATPGANYIGAGTGFLPNIQLSVSAPNIAYVKIHDSGNTFTVDDFAFTAGASAVPLPPALAGGLALLGVLGAKKRLRGEASA